MNNENIVNAPIIEFLIIFVTYGGLLLVTLTTLFWYWSAEASIGSGYLILVAPIVMGIIAYLNRQKRINSKYHNWVYLSGLLYFVIAPLIFLILYLVNESPHIK